MQRFHHSQFADTRRLLDLKLAAGRRISVCIPTLNEAETIGSIVGGIRSGLIDEVPLIDEVLVIDSDSADDTRKLAGSAGAVVFRSAEIAPEKGTHTGKGRRCMRSAAYSSRGLALRCRL